FQALEATWRSMHGLVAAVDTNAMLKIKVFNATKDELWSDMEKVVQFDQSTLFKLIYGSEYDTYGGCPYGLLLGGFEIGSSSRDIS
ncbi:type VI secretion system contractile sheath large subunit, partial [Undibacterium seohonense]|nr:type VI secretion system contractile sheath large subunit [Undibacterium seohonense]